MAILKSTQIKGDLTVTGSLNVQGDLTYVGVENLRVKDHQIELNANDSGSASLAGADQAGIVIRGARKTENVVDDASILYNYGDDTLVVNKTIKGTVASANNAASADKVANKLTVNVTDETGSVKTVEFDGSEVKTVDVNLKGLQDQINSLTGGAGSIATQISNAIKELDVTDATVDGQYVSSVSETDGKISVTRAALPDYSETYDAKGTAAQALVDAKSYANGLASNYDAAGTAAGLNAAMDTRVKALEGDRHTHTNKEELDKIASGDVAKWNGKQDALSEAQLAAVDSGITATKVTGYDNHVADKNIHVTTADKDKWNAAEQNAKKYTDDEIKKLGSAAKKNVLTGTIADSSSEDLVTAAQVKAYAAGVVGAMHFRGAVESTGSITDAASGDICLVGTKEYVYNGTEWVLFGDEGAYDTKGSAATAEQNAKNYADGLAKNYAAAKHSHVIADVTGLDTALAGKAAVDHNHDTVYSKLGHTHATSEITGLDNALDAKQNALNTNQLAAVNSGVTADKVSGYDAHLNDATKHITADERKAWNAAEQNAKDYADGLASNYDAAGSAATVKSEVIGTNSDAADKNTIYGAKKYADAAVKTLSDSVTAKDADQDTEITNIKNDITNIQNGTTLDGKYVNVSGDTMTGDLTMSNSGIVFGGMKIVWNVKDSAIEFVPTTA